MGNESYRKYSKNEIIVAILTVTMKNILHYIKSNNVNINNNINTHSKNNDLNNKNYSNQDSKETIPMKEIEVNEYKKNQVTLNVPIIIAEKVIDIPISSKVKLKEYTSEIKDIRSSVYLTESKVIPIKSKEDKSSYKNGKIFIKGFLKNNIEYTSIDYIEKNSISGNIKYTTVYIPFQCTALVNFSVPKVFFDKPIYCSIKKAEIFGSNLYTKDKSIYKNFIMDKLFKEFEQKIIVKLTLSLTQEQKLNKDK